MRSAVELSAFPSTSAKFFVRPERSPVGEVEGRLAPPAQERPSTSLRTNDVGFAAGTAYTADMAEETDTAGAIPSLEDWQHWTWVMGRAQQMLMETWADGMKQGVSPGLRQRRPGVRSRRHSAPLRRCTADPAAMMSAGAEAWAKGLETWGKMHRASTRRRRKARRIAASPRPNGSAIPCSTPFAKPIWHFPTNCLVPSRKSTGLDDETRQKMRFAIRNFVDAMSPSNFALTNPQVLKRTIETRGENLLSGLANMLNDISAGQLTQTKSGAFEVGRNLATTPGKVIKETPLYQLIQYTPTTDEVLETPVVIFPPWINRFYILDLTPEKSFVEMVRRSGHQPVHGQLEVGRREPRRDDARRLCPQRADRRDRHDPRPAGRRRRAWHRLLRGGHDAGRDARLSSRARSKRPRSHPRPS